MLSQAAMAGDQRAQRSRHAFVLFGGSVQCAAGTGGRAGLAVGAFASGAPIRRTEVRSVLCAPYASVCDARQPGRCMGRRQNPEEAGAGRPRRTQSFDSTWQHRSGARFFVQPRPLPLSCCFSCECTSFELINQARNLDLKVNRTLRRLLPPSHVSSGTNPHDRAPE